MHKFAIVVGCIAVGLVSPACLAQDHPLYNFVRANTNDEQFRHDRDICVAHATTVSRGMCTAHMSYYADTPGGPPQVHNQTDCYDPPFPTRNTDAFDVLRCMAAKGYQQTSPSMPAGRPGLYELRKFSNLAVFNPRSTMNTLPQVQRRASNEALARPGPVFQMCVAPDGDQQLGAVAGLSARCSYFHVISTRAGFAAEARCPGEPALHLSFDAATPERGEFTVIRQSSAMAAVPHVEKYQIHWLAPDCGTLPPRTVRTEEGKLVTVAESKPVIRSFATTLP
ncbi:MAG: hypothetical protein P4L57_13625 [Rhizomicrobium sp.]|nr:hypothetical protein [Rhizomicrobium sp.]